MDYPFDTAGLSSETIDTFDDTYKLLKSRFRVEHTGNIDFHLENFEVFSACGNVNIRGSYVLKNALSDCYMLFVEIHNVVKGGSARSSSLYDSYQYQSWALAYLKKDFGRVLIRPETLIDKIIELVHPVELDFDDDKAFSDTFYVLTNDRQKAGSAMDRKFRNVVMDVRETDLVIEIINHTLIIGNHKSISPENAVHQAEFIIRIGSNC